MDRVRPNPSLLQLLVIAIIGVGLLVFLIIAFNTGDLLWFMPGFEGIPASIQVNCYGQDVVINPGDPSYQAVNEAVNSTLSGSKRWDELSLSDVTQTEYQTSPDAMVIELSYDPPARIHSSYKFFKNFDTLLIPLDGRHASTNTLFGLQRGYIEAGSLHFSTMQPILDALEQESICSKKSGS
jgi:hypothetical protein